MRPYLSMYRTAHHRGALTARYLCAVAAMIAAAASLSAGCAPTIKVATTPALTEAQLDGDKPVVFTDFSLEDHRGETVTLSEKNRDAIVVLIFYRGLW